ncbi:MAG: hypothetical protein RL065_1506, partial [Bacteroidota bacterium]
MNKISTAIQLFQNMGSRYVAFRVLFELKKKSGLLKSEFPVNPPTKKFISLANWRTSSIPYFFDSKESLQIKKLPNDTLQKAFEKIENGYIRFFNADWILVGKDYDWITNPDSKFTYDVTKHWVEIPDFTTTQGDIKYVWEKSRFNYLLTVIRHDYHFSKNHDAFVLNEIESWIDKNPINCGPNYRCSQEISLRILNWTFALNY